jgi:hypothetical protein
MAPTISSTFAFTNLNLAHISSADTTKLLRLDFAKMLSLYTAVKVLALLISTRIVYLCYFHPLARYPGPFLARFTNLWFVPVPSILYYLVR